MTLAEFAALMPKAELHVHLEGAIQPETLLRLSRRNKVPLPASTLEGLRSWYRFTGFPHFLEVYLQLSECIRTPDDIELIAREFLKGQAAQNILYSEVTYTAYTHWLQKGLPFEDQLAALNRARAWGEGALDTQMRLIIDIPRQVTASEGRTTAEWAISAMGDGVVALGLAGHEADDPAEKFTDAFAMAQEAGLPCIPHAGETAGPESIWGALQTCRAARIGHGVRCLEDPALVKELRERQIPLEVCPSSNVCLGVVPNLESHPLPELVAEGLYVTLNSDDPALFNTTLTDEYLKVAAAFGFDRQDLENLVMNAVRASLLHGEEKATMVHAFQAQLLTKPGTSPSGAVEFDSCQ
jgi:adenosine deaminase